MTTRYIKVYIRQESQRFLQLTAY